MSDGEHATAVEYREIPRLPGYRFGSDGSVWSRWGRGAKHPGRDWMKLKTNANSHGYRSMCARGKVTLVHHLILEAFVGPTPEGMECRHLNGERDDNRIANLAWGTRAENVADTIGMGRHGMPSGDRK